MRTYRGVVSEKKTTYMVFLTENGEFLRGVPIGDPPEIGEEAEFTLVAPSVIGKAKPRVVGAVFVAAALLFFVLSSLIPLNDKVMAYVQLEAGTAMEFGVNRKGNVISLRYLNETPDKTGSLKEWEGYPLSAVLDMAVLKLAVHDSKVVVTTIYPSSESKQEASQVIGGAVQEVSSKHRELNWQIDESTFEERTVADEQNMSIHQFKSSQNDKAIEKPMGNQSEKPSEKPVGNQSENRSQKPVIEKQPSEETKPTTSTPVQGQKSQTGPPPHASPKQNGKSEEKSKGPKKEWKNPRAEQNQKNKENSERPNPAADKENGPHPSSTNKNNKEGQGPPSKNHKEHQSKEKNPESIK
ncbi:anti-sigma-I factor RsgI family protein [Sporosarcina sp. ACRSL]|uniref:anti-sigma-I factor RsgI family protein n=1 Tax=Sporosarcina sp. ACRSL TaxID=2918215 RepID=UPI001EF61D0C|nr:hypothetical protein [Sporosarcina sp. ACRSL]